MTKTPTIKLASGYEMPLVGFGVWKIPKDKTADAVYNAIKQGYRHIDGAHDYQNSAEAGQGVRRAIDEGVVKRDEVFITSKLWNNYHAHDNAIMAAKVELEAWGLEYLDLFLIHFPVAQKFIPMDELKYPVFWSDKAQKNLAPLEKVPHSETWAALESLVRSDANPSGIFRSIGVANFHHQLLIDLLAVAKTPVSVLQIEHHPYLVQPTLVKLAHDQGVAVTAYSSFGPQSFLEMGQARAQSTPPLFENEAVVKVAKAHGKTPAQVLLRWATQRNVVVIPKSNSPERSLQNLESVAFDLTQDEIDSISALDQNIRFNNPSDFGLLLF